MSYINENTVNTVLLNQSIKCSITKAPASLGLFLIRQIRLVCGFLCIVYGAVEFVLNFLARRSREFTYDVNRNRREHKARYNFIKAEPAEVLPDEYRKAANDDTGQGAVTVHAFPIQRHEDARAEGGTESSPGIGDHGKDVVIWIHTEKNRKASYNEDCKSADIDEFFSLADFRIKAL